MEICKELSTRGSGKAWEEVAVTWRYEKGSGDECGVESWPLRSVEPGNRGFGSWTEHAHLVPSRIQQVGRRPVQ